MPFRPLSAASLIALALGLAAPAAQAFTLHVLHVNDTHSRIEAVNKTDLTCSDEDEAKGACFGGSARLKTAVDAARKSAGTEPVILLDAGDQFQGSLFFTAYSGQVEAEMMNRIGFDAMALGNHEFDLGDEALTRFADTLQAPLLAGSVDASGDAALAGQLSKPLVLEVGARGWGSSGQPRRRRRKSLAGGRACLRGSRADGGRGYREPHSRGGGQGDRAQPSRRPGGHPSGRDRAGDRHDRGGTPIRSSRMPMPMPRTGTRTGSRGRMGCGCRSSRRDPIPAISAMRS